MDCSLPASSVHEIFPGKDTGVGCHFPLQGIFPTQGSNPGLLHCRQILYPLSYKGSPVTVQILVTTEPTTVLCLFSYFLKKLLSICLVCDFFFSTTCLSNDWHIYFSNDQSILPPYPQISFQKSTAFLFQWR